jgi:hypothetical protein
MDDLSPQIKEKSLKLWTRDSYFLFSVFVLSVFVVMYFWWPLAKSYFWRMNLSGDLAINADYLLLGIFAFMTFAMILRANIKRDILLVFVAAIGGLVIEAWGTQTNLWFYYTAERPPLWIIPAWPIASLTIDRISRFFEYIYKSFFSNFDLRIFFKISYFSVFSFFLMLMISFIDVSINKPLSIFALIFCVYLIFSPFKYRRTLFIFIAGALLGCFLELWGTTRHCWTYYTLETPPLFAVLAHGMASVAFYRVQRMLFFNIKIWTKLRFLE